MATMKNTLHCTSCLLWLAKNSLSWDTIFADPPDNINLKYQAYDDRIPDDEYVYLLRRWLFSFIQHARCVWFSYNVKWWAEVGSIVIDLRQLFGGTIKIKPCVQTYTFGQHNQRDFGSNHRPILRITRRDAPLYPDAIRVQSQRQINGDQRANPAGRVPGDVFDFPRVVGNSKQRRSWHPTQLHEGFVSRCIKMTTLPGERVLDPFGGTGTTLRVCKQLSRKCTLLEVDYTYCEQIAKENALSKISENTWSEEL
ncbi:MAG: site-specific DNA-methyltransferase [Nitrosomonadaceae bacterium]